QAGQELTASPGSWSGGGELAFAYTWQRCDPGGGACADVAGVGGASYTPAAADLGWTLRVSVTATNAAGSASAFSEATGVVATAAGYSTRQLWPYVAGVDAFWTAPPAGAPPAIAIVDSGVDASAPDLAGHVVQQVTLTSLSPNSPGDGR